MKTQLTHSEKQLILEEITFYSLCSEEDRRKILEQEEMSFDDFRRLCLLMDYLELRHLRQFVWDLHGYKFMPQIDALYDSCKQKGDSLPDMLLQTGTWLNDFQKHAPNATVAFLLHKIFLNGLDPKDMTDL